jgi:hypothetical protein
MIQIDPRLASELAPGTVGPYIDEVPVLTAAHVLPYAIAILLHRGAVRPSEILAAITPHVSTEELKVGGWDPIEEEYCEGTRAEKVINQVLGELIYRGMVRYGDEHGLWVLSVGEDNSNLPTIISWVTVLGGKMPDHLLMEMSHQRIV